ncbi:hypothetical protein B7C51_17480 [Paenibacillus larvae subsp. pulvifaciens]|uniref:Uncharacterized protein n=1 Tax=Paenibacillus larvae subsp. pulvifaciens TaxID=1477 RepID=A0A1V0UVG0_9BACL|nr:hypothetical protein B7C51_17480 [Paenibacillus larvae subsp. pulvifaciens]
MMKVPLKNVLREVVFYEPFGSSQYILNVYLSSASMFVFSQFLRVGKRSRGMPAIMPFFFDKMIK